MPAEWGTARWAQLQRFAHNSPRNSGTSAPLRYLFLSTFNFRLSTFFPRVLSHRASACMLTWYGQTTKTDCADCSRWLGLPRGNARQRDRSGSETDLRLFD